MKRAVFESYIVVVLFVAVMVVFIMAERDTKKLDKLYNSSAKLGVKNTTAHLIDTSTHSQQ
jgi:hypothetical protein